MHRRVCPACGDEFMSPRALYCSTFCRTHVAYRRASWAVVEARLADLTGRAPHSAGKAPGVTLTAGWISERTSISVRTVQRWRATGYITVLSLEALAAGFGEHPVTLYPGYYELTSRGELS